MFSLCFLSSVCVCVSVCVGGGGVVYFYTIRHTGEWYRSITFRCKLFLNYPISYMITLNSLFLSLNALLGISIHYTAFRITLFSIVSPKVNLIMAYLA